MTSVDVVEEVEGCGLPVTNPRAAMLPSTEDLCILDTCSEALSATSEVGGERVLPVPGGGLPQLWPV